MTFISNLRTGLAIAALAVAMPALAAPVLADGSFETPSSSPGFYQYPTGTYGSWTYAGAAIVNSQGNNAWYGSTGPAGGDGDQFVALQTSGGISQSFTATAKAMTLSWLNAGRSNNGGNETFAVTLNGTQVSGTRSTIQAQDFRDQSKVINGLTVGQVYTLGFKGLVTASDQTAFIDKVALVAAPLRANQIDNGSFESPLNPGNYQYFGGLKDGWTYGGSALVNAETYSAWYGVNAPGGYAGTQFAALQGGSSLSQSFTAYNGNLKFSWLAGGRPLLGSVGGNQTYTVEVDGIVVGNYGVTNGQAFGLDTVEVDHLARGVHTLTFQGLSTTDQTAFIDSVAATAIPEPAVWLLMVGGFSLIGAATRRRSSAVAA